MYFLVNNQACSGDMSHASRSWWAHGLSHDFDRSRCNEEHMNRRLLRDPHSEARILDLAPLYRDGLASTVHDVLALGV